MTKYTLIKEKGNSKLFRIKALKSFNDVKEGDLGGFVESENNLHQEGNCWVYENAQVYGSAMVYGNARVFGNATVYGDAMVYGDAKVGERSSIKFGHLTVNITKNKNIIQAIRASLDVASCNNEVILYKRVNKTNVWGHFSSIHKPDFIYTLGEIVEEKNARAGVESCCEGIHASTATYWQDGDTLIALEIDINDIITCQEGKVRCSKAKVLGVCDE